MTNTDRLSREQETRVADDIHDDYGDSFDDEPALLDTKHMPPREGMVQRWVRTSINSEDDQANVYRRMNQGWKPRLADTVPKGQYVPTVNYQGSNIIGIHGNILMERPIERHAKQKRREENLANAQMESVTNSMHKVHEKGSGVTRPEFTEQRSSVDRGRVAPVADD